MRTRGDAKQFRELERVLRDTANAAGGVAVVLENPEHTEDDLQKALGRFMLRLLKMQKATR